MKLKNKILIIGARGEVGRHAIFLLKKFGYTVITAGRQTYHDSDRHFVLDVFDTSKLAIACREADLVLNTAGPSSVIKTQIATVALSEKKHYVDVAGDPRFEVDLYRLHKIFPTSCVLGAGYIPGFASMLPEYAYNYFQVPTEITLYCGGIEVFTSTSAYDFLISQQIHEQGKSGICWQKGKFVQASPKKAFQLSGVTHLFDAIPYLNFEHLRWIANHKIRNFSAYNLIMDKRLLGITHKSTQAVNKLIKISQDIVDQIGKQQYLLMEAKGFLAERFSCLQMRMDFKNSYKLTGTVCALTVKQVLENPKKGLCWLDDYFDTGQLIDLLISHRIFDNYTIETQLEDHHIPFEEGEI